ncbi:MAG: hypothetical protein MI757_08500, partial [Pirellulales bacterium]|nr:hypothetical protein [Pirellulales bacterium]
ADGNPTHYADGSPAYHVDGTPVDYRPRNIQRELATMPTLFIRDVGQPRIGFEGPSASPRVEYLSMTDEARVVMQGDPNVVWKDPASGATCWRALTCEAPGCRQDDGSPLVFAASVPGYTGKVPVGDALQPLRCPHCGREETVTKYFPPDTASRMESLRAELARLRAQRRAN